MQKYILLLGLFASVFKIKCLAEESATGRLNSCARWACSSPNRNYTDFVTTQNGLTAMLLHKMDLLPCYKQNGLTAMLLHKMDLLRCYKQNGLTAMLLHKMDLLPCYYTKWTYCDVTTQNGLIAMLLHKMDLLRCYYTKWSYCHVTT
jgi:hypothetical protein